MEWSMVPPQIWRDHGTRMVSPAQKIKLKEPWFVACRWTSSQRWLFLLEWRQRTKERLSTRHFTHTADGWFCVLTFLNLSFHTCKMTKIPIHMYVFCSMCLVCLPGTFWDFSRKSLELWFAFLLAKICALRCVCLLVCFHPILLQDTVPVWHSWDIFPVLPPWVLRPLRFS